MAGDVPSGSTPAVPLELYMPIPYLASVGNWQLTMDRVNPPDYYTTLVGQWHSPTSIQSSQ